MKSLVVGASGLVGSALMHALEQAGMDVTGTYHRRPVPNAVQLDIRARDAVIECVKSVAPSVVFVAVNNPGGVDRGEIEQAEALAIHGDGARNVAIACRRYGAKMVFFSTDYIFDGRAGPYSEEESPNPLSAYASTKYEAERAVIETLADYLIIRTTWVFGWNRASPNFAMQVWENLQAGKQLLVASDQWANPTLADYLAEASIRLVQMGASGVVNVVGKDRMARPEFARLLARTMALDASLIEPVPTADLRQAAPRPLQGGLTTDRLKELLGTEAMDLSEAIKRYRRHWRSDTHLTYKPTIVSDEAAQLKDEILEKVDRYYELVHKPKEFVPFKTRVNYSGRVFGAEELANLVSSSMEFWLTLGPYGDLFEQNMKRYLGVKDFALVNSGSTANLTAVLSLMSAQLDRPLRPADEVITPAVTFPTTLAPIIHSGLVPVFVDCEIGTYNINPHLIEDAVSDKTRAIMVPHTLGNPCDLDIIRDVCERYQLFLIEDTCDALGGTFRGQMVGTFGDLGTVSFYPAHQMTLGEGGGVIVNRAGLSRIVRSVRDWGRDCWCATGESNTCSKRFGWELGDLPRGYDHKYIYSNLGYNFKPTDMQAAIGVAQLDRLNDFVQKRRHNFMRLYQGLQAYQDHLILPTLDPRSNPSWFGFPITVQQGISRLELVQWLENSGIETRLVFGGNILRQPAFQNITCRVHRDLEQSDRVMRDTFFIGVYPGLTDEMVDFMLERLTQFLDLKGAS